MAAGRHDRTPFASRAERVFRAVQRGLYRATGGRVGGSLFGRPVLLLTTTGGKSGRVHTVPLVFLPLEEGGVVVAASNASNSERDPAWLHNVRANPRVDVQIGAEARPRLAEVLPPSERDELWPRYVAAYPNFADYQRRTRRTIPLVRLRPA